MNIKHIKNAFGFAFAAIFFVGCTDVESINDVDLNQTIKTDEYYAALRKWKETPGLPQVFVWFDNWTGTSPTGENSLRGLPAYLPHTRQTSEHIPSDEKVNKFV